MPMLPSGRHIAVQPDRLFELIRDPNGHGDDGRLFAIHTVEDVKRYLDVIELEIGRASWRERVLVQV